MTGSVRIVDGMSVAHGIPLAEEAGVGALTLGGYVREIAERYGPREAAVIHLDGKAVRWTYAELYERAMDVARSLVALGVGKGTRVGIIMTNRHEFLASVFGAALAGGVATPISTFYTPAEMEVVLRASGVSVLLIERHVLKKDFARMLVELEPTVATAPVGELASTMFPFLRHIATIDPEPLGTIEGWADFLARGKAVSPDLVLAAADCVAPADPGILLFSSGSTGKAKGILSAHRGVCLQLWRWPKWYAIDPAAPPRTWSANGFFWSGNFTMALGGTLSSGGTLLLQRWFDPAEALDLMDKEKATMPLAWPHQWPQLADAPNYASADLSAMRYVDMFMPIAQHPTIHSTWREPAQAYGNTETFTLISVFPVGTPPEVAGDSHGIPTAGSTIKIVEPMTGATLPLGERGEIAVKGPTLMLGYIGIPLDESLDEDGFLRTADGGFIDEQGRLHWEGRLNDIIKTGGANVSPLEIDAVIREHPEVKVSQTVGVPDELLGELVVTCIVPLEGTRPDAESIRGFAREKLASYKVPRRVLFVEESELETTGSAKIKTAELRKLAAARLEALAG
ncbi:class I adenylate-forming enzyme family protein [Novosphingobium album (ex Liu et al. 2023)]|uniref:Class I adenylate-forming enzyme family protein n=1 Tax=Novosphingobium album (ex Liu et al. 2023) TaxID=3031130 RepID=A0ABT5WUB7_9SPHN|nr:class I adenylate-forming enzyme family protein [Novosphingobium album (ex Liu et al. 2023)]MDE8653479.1 class I adenylate-forming enzyme family protein [Novosphingobium album (ex Liu et al. 2023)]